jgi:hypothetical protein
MKDLVMSEGASTTDKEQVILDHLLDGHLGRVVAQSHSVGMDVHQWTMKGISKSF